jgi:methylated-DNA-[protein]-cysteine S-methyltransferase
MWKQEIASPVGSLQASWSEDGLYAFSFLRSQQLDSASELLESVLPDAGSTAGEPTDMPRRIRVLNDKLRESLHTYFETGELVWSLEHLDWTGVSDFHREVLRLCHAIPVGETLTYGQLAKLAGSPHAARAVGGAMARNRWPLIVPCHRVVGSSGKLTGYSGEGGLKTKHWLLEHEFHAAHGNLFLTRV